MAEVEKYSITLKIEHSAGRFNYPVRASTEKTHDFLTLDELESELKKDVAIMSLQYSDYYKDLHKVLRSWINPSLTLKVTVNHNERRDLLEKALRHVGKKHSNISTIILENENAHPELNGKLKKIIENRDKEIYRRMSRIRNAIIIPVLLGTLLCALGAAPLIATHFIIKEAIKGILLITARQWYLDSAAKHYAKKQQINDVTDHGVITALEKGTQSLGWGNYFLNQFSYSAWRHPQAFAAGLELANENKEKKLNLIHEKYAANRAQ